MTVPVSWEMAERTNDIAGPGTRHPRGASSFPSQKLGSSDTRRLSKLSLRSLWPPVSRALSSSDVWGCAGI